MLLICLILPIEEVFYCWLLLLGLRGRKRGDLIALISNDNKRTRFIALKAKLRSLKLGDLTINAYFRKIKSIATILTSLGSPINNDDVVTIALEGFPNKYENVFGIIVHREPFPVLKTVHSMLTNEEMRLKSRAQATSINSTSYLPMVLLANSGNNTCLPPVAPGKINKSCFNFVRGLCRFGDTCKYMHGGTTNGVNGNKSLWSTSTTHPTSSSTTPNMTPKQIMALIQLKQALLAQFGYLRNNNDMVSISNASNATVTPLAFHTGPGKPLVGFTSLLGFSRPLFGLPQFGNQPTRPTQALNLYPVTKPSTIPHAFLTSQYMWHQRLGHPGSEVLRRLLSSNSILCNKEKPPVLCHACQLGKHVRLPFASSSTLVQSCFDIIHSDLWTFPIPSLSGFKYYVSFLDHYSQYVWCDHGGEFDNHAFHKLFASHGIQFRFSYPKTSPQNVFPFGSITPTASPLYAFLEEPTSNISHIIRSSPTVTNRTPPQMPINSPQPQSAHTTVNESPQSHISPQHQPTPTSLVAQSTQQGSPPPAVSPSLSFERPPQPISPSFVNPNPVLIHPMVTRFRVGSNCPTKRLNLHVSTISPLPISYVAFNDPNWLLLDIGQFIS
ncbi:ribonuclease H-like domain-containing protein [Tanacetum coccineum]